MRSLFIGLGVGIAAGILDILPMLLRKMPARAVASAFVQWLVLGLVIAHLRSPCHRGQTGWPRASSAQSRSYCSYPRRNRARCRSCSVPRPSLARSAG